MRTALERLACAASELNTGCDAAQAMERLDLFHSMKIFWKHCRKMLENLISIVLSNSIVWKYSIRNKTRSSFSSAAGAGV